MNASYRLNDIDSIAFEHRHISALQQGETISWLTLETYEVVVTGGTLSARNIRKETMEALTRFIADHREALQRLS